MNFFRFYGILCMIELLIYTICSIFIKDMNTLENLAIILFINLFVIFLVIMISLMFIRISNGEEKQDDKQ